MAVTQYKDISWGDEPISTDKMNQMAQNDKYLNDTMPRVWFRSFGVNRQDRVKVMVGAVLVPKSNSQTSSQRFYFGSYFSQGCIPIIQTAMNPQGTQWKLHHTIKGINSFFPDNVGFTAIVGANESRADRNKILAPVWIHFVAWGW